MAFPQFPTKNVAKAYFQNVLYTPNDHGLRAARVLYLLYCRATDWPPVEGPVRVGSNIYGTTSFWVGEDDWSYLKALTSIKLDDLNRALKVASEL